MSERVDALRRVMEEKGPAIGEAVRASLSPGDFAHHDQLAADVRERMGKIAAGEQVIEGFPSPRVLAAFTAALLVRVTASCPHATADLPDRPPLVAILAAGAVF